MADLINGRTPEEIKERLGCCSKENGCLECPDVAAGDCSLKLCADALTLIEHLEAERDALLKEVHGDCDKCKHYDKAAYVEPCKSCRKASGREGFEWRGFKPPEVSDGAV